MYGWIGWIGLDPTLITMLNCCSSCISWEIGSYNTQQSRHNEHMHFCREIHNMIFRKLGGVKGRLELFRKFIRFGDAVCLSV